MAKNIRSILNFEKKSEGISFLILAFFKVANIKIILILTKKTVLQRK
jgi:hypothetical protein